MAFQEGEERGQGGGKTKNKEMFSALKASSNSWKKGIPLDNGAIRETPVAVPHRGFPKIQFDHHTKNTENHLGDFLPKGAVG